MSVLNRRLFNRGGRVMSSRGVGITSGLVPSYAHGGLHEEAGGEVNPLQASMTNKLQTLESLNLGRPELSSKSEMLAPSLLKFFGGLMSGKSYQGGLGGGLDIAGQTLQASAPDFAQAQTAMRKEKLAQTNFDNTLKLKSFDMAYDELASAKAAANKQTYSSSKYEVRMKNNEEGATEVATEFFNKGNPNKTYYTINGKEIPQDQFDIIGNLGTASDSGAKQNFTYQDYNVTLNDDSEVTLTKVIDKTGTNPPKWIDATGTDFDSSKLKSINGTLGVAKEAAEPKKRTPTTETFYAPNPKWIDGDDITKKYFQLATKIDEDNNITLKDPNTNQYISEEEFTKRYNVSAVADQPLDWKPSIEKEISGGDETNEINRQKKVFKDQFLNLEANTNGIELNEADLDFLISAFPPGSDFIKSFQAGQVNELDNELFKILEARQRDNESYLLNSKSLKHKDGTTKDAVDVYYNLDNRKPDYNTKKPYFVQKYNAIPMMDAADQKAVNESIASLKDLNVIFDNVEEAIALFGGPIGKFSEVFGVNLKLVEFLTAKKGLEATAIEQLVSGVPSNFDAQRIIETLPNESLDPATNKIRIKRLKQIFGDVILNNIKHNVQLGKRVPADMVLLARELGDVKEIDRILRGEVDTEKVSYLNNISAGLEGFTKKGYIEKFGDSFSRSISLVNTKDEDFITPLSDAEREKLKEYKKKMMSN